MTLPGEKRLSVGCLIRHIFECLVVCICGLFYDLSWELRRYWWLFKCSWNPWNMLALLIYYVMICLLFYLDIVSFLQWFHWIIFEMLLFEHIVVIILVVINIDGYFLLNFPVCVRWLHLLVFPVPCDWSATSFGHLKSLACHWLPHGWPHEKQRNRRKKKKKRRERKGKKKREEKEKKKRKKKRG